MSTNAKRIVRNSIKNFENKKVTQPDLFKSLKEQQQKIREELKAYKIEHHAEIEAKKAERKAKKENHQKIQAEKVAKEIVKAMIPKMKSVGLTSFTTEPKRKWKNVNLQLLADFIKSITGNDPIVIEDSISISLQTKAPAAEALVEGEVVS